jgi:hypothetical protein
MKRNVRLLVWCVLLIILGVSCESSNTNAPIPSVTPEILPNWWTAWLAQPECKPPCWQNITPGVTTRDEAVSILENTPGIVITYDKKDGLSWNFGTKTEEGNINLSEGGIVSGIWIGSISDRKLLLKTIIASYDNPEYVKPYDCREGMCSTALVYPDLGMLLSVFVENKGANNDSPQFEILPNTVVDRVYFIEPGMENSQNYLGFQDNVPIMVWKGYGEYP